MENEFKTTEQSKLTLAAIFVATYLTIIFGFGDKLKISLETTDIINQLIFLVFVSGGIMITAVFFLYLVFTALSLSSKQKKEIILDQEISEEKLFKVKENLYDFGVRCIFLSFTYPIYYFAVFLIKTHGYILGLVLEGFCLGLIYILIHILFKD